MLALDIRLESSRHADVQILPADLAFKRAQMIAEHDDLDCAIAALEASAADDLMVRRLKKRKLLLKDEIAAVA